MEQWYCAVGKEQYGPVDRDTVCHWLAEGRIKPTDLVWHERMEEWKPVSSVPEFQDVQNSTVKTELRSYSPLPNAPGAVASMVCGITGVVSGAFCCCVAGIVLGIIAILQRKKALDWIEQDPGKYGGQGLCTAGYVLGIISIVLGLLSTLYWLFVIIVSA